MLNLVNEKQTISDVSGGQISTRIWRFALSSVKQNVLVAFKSKMSEPFLFAARANSGTELQSNRNCKKLSGLDIKDSDVNEK